MSFIDSISPEMQTINDQLERDAAWRTRMAPKVDEIMERVNKFFLTGVPKKKAYVTLVAQYQSDSLRAAAETINDLLPYQLSPTFAAAVIVNEAYGRTEFNHCQQSLDRGREDFLSA
jgi:hypothetical protein